MGLATKEVELVANNPEQKNWKGIGIAVVVIIVVLALVVTAVILVTPVVEDADIGDKFSFEALMDSDMSPRPLQAKWVGADTYVHRDGEGAVVATNLTSSVVTFIMDNTTFRQLNTDRFWVSADLKFVLLAYNIAKVNRHTTLAYYKVYDRETSKLRNLPSSKNEQALIHASWGPEGNSLAYVLDNVLYHQPDVYTDGKNVSRVGDPDYIKNAIPDWLYEEEVLRRDNAYWWSPTGKFIVYASFNDSKVPVYQFPYYGGDINVVGTMKKVRYPKAGDFGTNPSVELHAVKVPERTVNHVIQPPAPFKRSGDYYLMEVSWKNDDTFAVIWMNRGQNVSLIEICSAQTAACFTNWRETTKDGGVAWLEMDQKPVFTPKGGKQYFIILPQQDGTAGYYQHVAMVTTTTNQEGHRTFLTHGQWDVTQVVGYNTEEQSVYVIATYDNPLKRRLLKIGTLTSPSPKQVTCLTCEANKTCEYVSATFSPSGRYYLISCLGPDVPSHHLRSASDPEMDVLLDGNEDFKQRVEDFGLPTKEYHTIQLDGGKYNTTMQIFLPPQLNKAHVTKYPALLYVYGGPNSQLVNYEYQVGLSAYFSSGQSMVFASLDGRGTKGRGGRFKQEMFKRFGTVEIDDQIEAIKYLRSLPYVDPGSVGVYGWSYGGFVTGHIIGRGTKFVRCGVMGVPVTDFRYYDTFYTERFMGTPAPKDNLNGYLNTNLMDRVDGFKYTDTLIIHGTGDDNVHFQNTAHLMRALTAAGIQFTSQIYPDERHQFSTVSARHMYTRITNFLNDCFANATTDYVAHPAIREPIEGPATATQKG